MGNTRKLIKKQGAHNNERETQLPKLPETGDWQPKDTRGALLHALQKVCPPLYVRSVPILGAEKGNIYKGWAHRYKR